MDFPYSNEEIEEIANWTLSGLTMYYRDSEVPNKVLEKYKIGQIIRSQPFVDVSIMAGGIERNVRYAIASAKVAKLFESPFSDPAGVDWRLCTMNCDSYFKIVDIYKIGDKTQVCLLHIPAKAIDFFEKTVFNLRGENFEETLRIKARESFDAKIEMPFIEAFRHTGWLNRTSFPIGTDVNDELFPLKPTSAIFNLAQPMHQVIKKMTNDVNGINEVDYSFITNDNFNDKSTIGEPSKNNQESVAYDNGEENDLYAKLSHEGLLNEFYKIVSIPNGSIDINVLRQMTHLMKEFKVRDIPLPTSKERPNTKKWWQIWK